VEGVCSRWLCDVCVSVCVCMCVCVRVSVCVTALCGCVYREVNGE
jgi:hypothetical protein